MNRNESKSVAGENCKGGGGEESQQLHPLSCTHMKYPTALQLLSRGDDSARKEKSPWARKKKHTVTHTHTYFTLPARGRVGPSLAGFRPEPALKSVDVMTMMMLALLAGQPKESSVGSATRVAQSNCSRQIPRTKRRKVLPPLHHTLQFPLPPSLSALHCA